MAFIPKVIRREKGDFVNSEEFNNYNRDLYGDLSGLFERELALYSRTKILSTMVEAATAGIERELRSSDNLPMINYTSEFIYPDSGFFAVVDPFFGEITSAIGDSRSEITDVNGKKKPEVEVTRSSDSLVFSKVPDSLTETRLEDSIEASELPYLIRIRGINEDTSIRLDVTSPFGTMDVNTIEFIPYPMIGGTEIRDIDITPSGGSRMALEDPEEVTYDFSDEARKYYIPKRFITQPTRAELLSFDTRSNLYIPSSDSIIIGINQIRILRNIYEAISYIGFKIAAQPGKSLVKITPVLNGSNTYVGNISFDVYSTMQEFKGKTANIDASFDSEGNGIPVSTDTDLYILATMETESNTSAQLIGFDYEVSE